MAIERNTLYCSFCGKSQYEVTKLIAGPTVFICNECVILCLDVLVDEKFKEVEGLSREIQIVRNEQRIHELMNLIRRLIDVEEPRNRTYARLKKEFEAFNARLNESPKVESSTSNDKESL